MVQCPHCKEGTQTGPAPRGKQFVICQCKALLTVAVNAADCRCPRAHCKQFLIIKPPASGKRRAMCAYCDTLLVFNWSAAAVVCPKCRGRSIVSRSKTIVFPIIYFFLGIVLLALGITSTVLTIENGSGWYWWGAIVGGVLFMLRGSIYLCLNW